MKPNTPNIAEIRAMVAAATPGPWKEYSSHYGSEVATNESIDSWICQLWYKDEEVMQNHKNNAHLIAKTPETITALCDEVERQREGWEVIANLPIGMHPSEIREFGKRMLKGETPYKLG